MLKFYRNSIEVCAFDGHIVAAIEINLDELGWNVEDLDQQRLFALASIRK